MIVFLCDDYVRVNSLTPEARTEAKRLTARFFSIASRLNMDLQMVLCNRLFGLTKDVVSSKFSETAFKSITRKYFVSNTPQSI